MLKNSILILLCSMVLGCSEPGLDSSMEDGIEKQFESNSQRPLEFSGSLDIIDASFDDNGPTWAIGTLAVENSSDEILVEFNGKVLQKAGVTEEFDYQETVTLWLNDAKNEYYQVSKME